MPDTIIFLINTLCKTLANDKETEKKTLRNMIGYIVFRKAITSALDNTFEYDIFENCRIPSTYFNINRIGHILGSLMTNNQHSKYESIHKANKFIEDSK